MFMDGRVSFRQVSPRDCAALLLVLLLRVHCRRQMVRRHELHRPFCHVLILRLQDSQVSNSIRQFYFF